MFVFLSQKYTVTHCPGRQVRCLFPTALRGLHQLGYHLHMNVQTNHQNFVCGRADKTLKCVSSVPEPISVNQDEQELRLMVWKRTTWLGSVPWLTATHTSGYSCSGTTSISNTRRGLGNGKSKCCKREKKKMIKLSLIQFLSGLQRLWTCV